MAPDFPNFQSVPPYDWYNLSGPHSPVFYSHLIGFKIDIAVLFSLFEFLNKILFQGKVVVIRGEGPKGGPGMPEMLTPTSAIMGAGLGKVIFKVSIKIA